jgi:UMF1 family MFS transporter
MNIRRKLAYAWYDFANSGFVIIFQSFLFPLFFVSQFDGHIEGTKRWGLILFISNLLAIIFSPIIGKLADKISKLKIFAGLIICVGILSALSIIPSPVFVIAVLFIVFNVSFELSQVIYDSFLYNTSNNEKEKTSISTFSWGFGYLGGLSFIAIYFLLSKLNYTDNIILGVSALLYLLLAIYSYHQLKLHFIIPNSSAQINLIQFRIRKELLPYLMVYFVIFVSIATLLHFSSIYFKEELGISQNIVGGIMLAGQILAFPLTVYAGKLANKLGTFKVIRYSLLVWCFGLLIMALSSTVFHVITAMVVLACVIGSTQSLIRSHYSSLVVENVNESYGFYGMANKSGYLLAPLLVTLSTALSSNMRIAFVVIFCLLAVAFWISGKVNE